MHQVGAITFEDEYPWKTMRFVGVPQAAALIKFLELIRDLKRNRDDTQMRRCLGGGGLVVPECC